MKTPTRFIISASLVALCFNAEAKENEGTHIKPTATVDNRSVMSGCSPATAQIDLDINNVRARILAGGDMWWDLLGEPKYFIPKPENAGDQGPCSLFAGSLWIGGIDAGKQLKVAAMTYRQSGNDFWPGPLSSSATIDPATCLAWDKFYKINRADVEAYYNWYINGQKTPNPVSPSAMDVINNWPATGPEGQALAPFNDFDPNGIYDPSMGDYPDFDITGTKGCNAQLYGDQCIFWVFNDKGNTHSQTGGQAIGLEIQAQAFAFQTTDEINNMTFYKYKIINKSSFRLDSTYFGVWDDPDLGYAYDDFVGCDVSLGLGIVYNADDMDGSGEVTSYGANPPAVGIDFFEGPYADADFADGDPKKVPPSFTNYGDYPKNPKGIDNERLGIGKFIYYNNASTPQGDPALAVHYYQYLRGIWKDGSFFTYGGDAHSPGTPCSYVFPGSSDPNGFGLGGDEYSPVRREAWSAAGTTPSDKRILESAGPFTLKPGAVNTITIGVPWARATQGGALASVALLKGADDKAQELFNRCFATLDGPTAPNLAIQELDKELILTWSNPKGSNNFEEKYTEDYDKSTNADEPYLFEGYQVYQLKDGTVGQTDLYNVDKARLVFQCDKIDSITQIVNYTNDPLLSALVPQEKVKGANKGIVHSVSVTTDKFATGNASLVNHKTYYYAIVAYGYSHSQEFNPNQAVVYKDYNPYLAGRKFSDPTFFHSAIPHIPSPESGGTEKHSVYGSGPKLTRVEGRGNGGLILDLTNASEAEILASPTARSLHPVYENGRGPVYIKVIDPLNVPEGDFVFTLNDTTKNAVNDYATWTLKNLTTGEVVDSDTSIKLLNEQLINGQVSSVAIPKWGLSVSAAFAFDPGATNTTKPFIFPVNNGFLEATMTFSDDTKQWLTGVVDQDGVNQSNWIRSGTAAFPNDPQYDDYSLSEKRDGIQAYEKVLGGTWAPYCLAGWTVPNAAGTPFKGGPAWNNSTANSLNNIKNLASVDVVITNDRSKWTRCPVLELGEDPLLTVGGAAKLNMRESPSVDKDGKANYPSVDNNDFKTGMGWFPGYAINIETGERLNMAFGEDSWLAKDNGADMKWNPTTVKYSSEGPDPVFGGKHYIYVFSHNGDQKFTSADPYLADELKEMPRYDAGKAAHNLLEAEKKAKTSSYKRGVFKDAMWVNIPILASGHSLMESDVRIRLRVSKSYQKYGTGTSVKMGDPLTPGGIYLLENGSMTYGSPAVVYNTSQTTGLTPITFTANSLSPTYTVTASSNPSDPSVVTTVNKGNPMYTFNTADLQTRKNDAATAKDALSLINIVPNPYYGYSSYEQAALDNVVKITNLPARCTISIYTLNGTLIRKIRKDDGDAKTSADWDLKNTAKVPVASGLYIVHVDVPGVGEKTLKWFGVMRPQDLEAY